MLIADRAFLKSDRRFREIWKRGGRGDSGANSDSSTPPPAVPPISGINFAFIDDDFPSGDVVFTLKDIAGGVLRYPITIVGAAGAEQIKIDLGGNYPDIPPPLVVTGLNYQFGLDNIFRIIGVAGNWHTLYGMSGIFDISARQASNPAAAVFISGLNFRFAFNLFQFKDEGTGDWVTPWISTASGAAILELV